MCGRTRRALTVRTAIFDVAIAWHSAMRVHVAHPRMIAIVLGTALADARAPMALAIGMLAVGLLCFVALDQLVRRL
jgi:hypothetical protein